MPKIEDYNKQLNEYEYKGTGRLNLVSYVGPSTAFDPFGHPYKNYRHELDMVPGWESGVVEFIEDEIGKLCSGAQDDNWCQIIWRRKPVIEASDDSPTELRFRVSVQPWSYDIRSLGGFTQDANTTNQLEDAAEYAKNNQNLEGAFLTPTRTVLERHGTIVFKPMVRKEDGGDDAP